MEERPQSYATYLPPALLFMDDIQEIETLLRRVSSQVDLESDKYKHDTSGELAQLKEEFITRLAMSAFGDNHVSLYLDPDNIWLSTNPLTPASLGTLHLIRDIILRRRRTLAGWARRRWLRFAPWFAGVAAIIVGLLALKGHAAVTLTGTCVFVGGVVWHVWASWVCRHRYSVIFLRKGPGDVSFWRRKRDEISLGIFFMLVELVLIPLLVSLWSPLFSAWSSLLRWFGR
jgi:hypothetical protein